MDRFLQSGTRKKRSATEILTGSTATKRLKTLENPAPDKVFYSRPDKHVKDPGFTVSRWGSLDHDSKHRGDIIPAGFSVERTMMFESTGTYEYDAENIQFEVSPHSITLKLPKRICNCMHTVRFRTRFDRVQNKMMYAVKAGRAAAFETQDWQASSTVAWNKFCDQSSFYCKQYRSFSGPKLFGILSDEVQAHLRNIGLK
jgi:hypothetical protein